MRTTPAPAPAPAPALALAGLVAAGTAIAAGPVVLYFYPAAFTPSRT